MYDVVLIEKPVGCGLKKTEVLDLFDTLTSDEAYPVEIEAEKHESSAMGLITTQAAENLISIMPDYHILFHLYWMIWIWKMTLFLMISKGYLFFFQGAM